ncbi:phage tail protein [Endozoicomonas ascidiicola]|uniref:phage tail-collar fiber domain-containing protein n=1 Tax=Endozoicomonas ascidiicola TaxID=1698521 RepID=UPI00082B0C65|nr:phage tail protein [Endozoicomonas ascidiicola]
MAEIITIKGENRFAECQGSQQVLTIDRFILSYDPDIDPKAPIDRNTPLPSANTIVYEDAVTQTGYVNPNQVVYSLFMESTVGPFEFNRMDLVESATDTNVAIATLPTQNKIADDPGAGIRGQSMTRNFMTVYDGAMAITNVTVEAATWQIDFMARLHASDELERLSSRDTWGRSCFWHDGFLVKKAGNQFQMIAGLGYVEGIRIQAASDQTINPSTLPTDVWLDVCRRGNLNGVIPEINVVFNGNAQQDYTDSQQVDHYLERIASINSAGTVTDRRTVHPIDDALLNYLVPEAPKDGSQYVRMDGQWVPVDVPINWSAPLATDGQTIVNPPYTFTAAEVYVNGVMQDQDRGAFIITESRIELAAPLNKGDAVQVILGSTQPAIRSTPEPGFWQLVTADYGAKSGDRILLDSSHQAFTVRLPKSPKPGEMIHFLEVGEAVEVHTITLDPQGLVIMNDIKMDVTTNKLSFEVLYTEQYGWRLME